MKYLEFDGVGYWDSSHIWYRDGLRGQRLVLTGIRGYGLEDGNFGILVHMRGQNEFWFFWWAKMV